MSNLLLTRDLGLQEPLIPSQSSTDCSETTSDDEASPTHSIDAETIQKITP